MIKVFKRYTVVSIMILLCFFSAFVALCNGLLATAQASDIIKTENEYVYTEEIKLSIRVTKSITTDELLQLTDKIEKCNIYLDSMIIYFDEIGNAYCPDVLLKQNEPLSLPTSKKFIRIPDNGIIVPSWVVNDELTIHGKNFHVIEKMDCDRYPFIVDSFTLNSVDYFSAFPDVLNEKNEISLRISSNTSDVYEMYSHIKEIIAEIIPEAVVFGRKTDSKVSIFQSALSMENIISTGLFLFALINTVIISYYWVVVRKREIAIRKAFGATDFSIMRLVTTELLKIIGIAALLASITQVLMWIIQSNSISFYNSIVLIMGMLIAITLATFIAMIVPVRIILNIQPSEGVKL